MRIADKPENEKLRLKAIDDLGLWESPPEERFDRFVRFAQRLFDVPIAFVSIVGEDVQWFKSIEGLSIETSPRELAICGHTMLTDDVLVIEDCASDARVYGNPFVVQPPYVRFYAGVRLNAPGDLCIGTLCILDTRPRTLTRDDIGILRDLARMVELELLAQSKSSSDDLTGLSNRKGFNDISKHAIAWCRRMEKPATLMYFDIENFRSINDDFGTDQGDRVLKEIAALLLQEFRNSDVVARLGADEFCVLLTGTDADQVDKPLANLRDAIHEENLNHPYKVAYRVGTVSFDSKVHKGIDDLMAAADAEMDKLKGRS
ncbi:MAG: sensor domain-containing diguanylate cyclase [Pseudomonadales bacterium]|nr:sensor domain-containing diguanylate cyclase [Pseudomonadales bacterium]